MRNLNKYLLLWFLSFSLNAFALSVAPKSVTSFVGQTSTVTVSNFAPPVNVTSENPGVAYVSLSGSVITINALRAGKTRFIVRDATKSLKISVKILVPMTVSPASLTLQGGKSARLTIKNASGKVSAFNSNNTIVSAKFSKKTINVSALNTGSAVITIRDKYMTLAVPVVVTSVNAANGYTLVAWNDLGMHCMDADYSIFSILPPFNNLHAQLVSNATGNIVTENVVLTYESTKDPDGSINTYSVNGPIKKTNFWDYVDSFFGSNPGQDVGLTGNKTASSTNPQPLTLKGNVFVASGIPITPYDDEGKKNTYPMVKVVARDNSGNQLASARVVLPVSDEMSCTSCHATSADSNPAKQAAKPSSGWVTDAEEANPERQYRLNILRLHDEKSATALEVSAKAGKPILCASCHFSNALGLPLVDGVKPLTESMHAKHAAVADPTNGLSLESSTNRSSCYQCHPGSATKCLRGAMGNATATDGTLAMQCQSCHGSMTKVGASGRNGWLEQPNCQACHHDGKRDLSALGSDGVPKKWVDTADTRFATNPDSPPGFSLYRFSSGHGGLQCEACHGSTHAEYTSSHVNDNLLSVDTQGHVGTIAECESCHTSSITQRNPLNGGPHGMHAIGQSWVSGHEDYAEHNQASCTYCHGLDYRGTALSKARVTRTFKVDDGRVKTFAEGQIIGCYDCHKGPSGGD